MKKAVTSRDIELAILEVEQMSLCSGSGHGKFATTCRGGIKKGVRCDECREIMKSIRKMRKREQKKIRVNNLKSKRIFKIKKQARQRMIKV